MRPFFRPMLAPTLWCAPLFLFLVFLGGWQLERLQWKLALIARVSAHMTAPPVTLDEAIRMGADAAYRRVTMRGIFLNDRESYAFATGPADSEMGGAPVYHVLTPFLTGGRVVMVDRGYVPPPLMDPKTRAAGQVAGETVVTAVWRVPDPPGWFTPAPDAARRIRYDRDVGAMAATFGLRLAAPAVLEADATPNRGGWPRGGQTEVAFRNQHLQYAITWFLLAAGLLGVYLAYHVLHKRLGLRP